MTMASARAGFAHAAHSLPVTARAPAATHSPLAARTRPVDSTASCSSLATNWEHPLQGWCWRACAAHRVAGAVATSAVAGPAVSAPLLVPKGLRRRQSSSSSEDDEPDAARGNSGRQLRPRGGSADPPSRLASSSGSPARGSEDWGAGERARSVQRVLAPAGGRQLQERLQHQPQPQGQLRPRSWQEEPVRQRQQVQQQQRQQEQQQDEGMKDTRRWQGGPHALRTGLALTWLGTNSGTFTLERNVSCTLVRLPNAVHMVDCGEGTHRQLLNFPAVKLADIDGIFITHLHGDHCFGLGAALALLDGAKAAAQTDPARRRNHVYGPPGLAELLRASLVVTGLEKRLQLPLTVTEFVYSPASAHPPRPLEGTAGDHRQSARSHAESGRASGDAGDTGCKLFVQRMAPRHVRDTPDLQAAVDAVRDRVASLDRIWYPPRFHPLVQSRGAGGYGAAADELLSSLDEEQDALSAPEVAGRGRQLPYVAAEGLFWEVPGCAGVRVRAAQLQHRVACWGYVFQELAPAQEGAKRRKVVVLGDTVSSHAIAPLAAGCDVLSHEATFAAGMEDKARIAQHSTGQMAGAFAAAVGARQLVLTHFSARYREGPREVDDARLSRFNSQREMEQQSWAVSALTREAARTFRRQGATFAASDFYTHHVNVRVAAGEDAAAAAGSGNASATAGRWSRRES